jgi:hypothetical protein
MVFNASPFEAGRDLTFIQFAQAGNLCQMAQVPIIQLGYCNLIHIQIPSCSIAYHLILSSGKLGQTGGQGQTLIILPVQGQNQRKPVCDVRCPGCIANGSGTPGSTSYSVQVNQEIPDTRENPTSLIPTGLQG